jgi:hypothetical protein
MKGDMKLKWYVYLGVGLCLASAGGIAKTRFPHSVGPFAAQTATNQNDVTDEEVLPQDVTEREARVAKNQRYNGGRCHIAAGDDCFFEIIEPWSLPTIPLNKSAFAFVGMVSKVQSYLSEDGTRIYTETTFHVQEVFKRPVSFALSSDRSLVIDRTGGAIRLRSGKILRDDTRDGFLGRPRVGMRYVLFADSIHEGKDFAMLRGYELRDGKVFRLTEDGRPSGAQMASFPQEETFLEAIREQAEN